MMEDRIRKWVLSLGILAIGFGLIWANFTVSESTKTKQEAIEACERNRSDRMIQQSGHQRMAQLMRVSSASVRENETLSREFNLAADRFTGLARELDPLININCKAEFSK